jgi:hypothetical protein
MGRRLFQAVGEYFHGRGLQAVGAPDSTKNKDKSRDVTTHQAKKVTRW